MKAMSTDVRVLGKLSFLSSVGFKCNVSAQCMCSGKADYQNDGLGSFGVFSGVVPRASRESLGQHPSFFKSPTASSFPLDLLSAARVVCSDRIRPDQNFHPIHISMPGSFRAGTLLRTDFGD